jgi:hypothetical protein
MNPLSVEKAVSLSLRDLKRYPQQEIEAFHQCAGNPFEPAEPSRQIANVVWQGADVRRISFIRAMGHH